MVHTGRFEVAVVGSGLVILRMDAETERRSISSCKSTRQNAETDGKQPHAYNALLNLPIVTEVTETFTAGPSSFEGVRHNTQEQEIVLYNVRHPA